MTPPGGSHTQPTGMDNQVDARHRSPTPQAARAWPDFSPTFNAFSAGNHSSVPRVVRGPRLAIGAAFRLVDIYVAYLGVDGRFRHPWLREGSPGSPRSLGRKIGVADRVGIAKGDRVSESEGLGVRTFESLVSIHGDVSDDGVVARPCGRVQFSGVGPPGTWTRFDLLSVAGSNVSRRFSSARDATAAIGTARPSVVRRRVRNRCAKRAGSTRRAVTANSRMRLASRGSARK